VESGEIFGLAGPDGAGKTTTLYLFAGPLGITSGKASLGGIDLETAADRVKPFIGYMSQQFSLYNDLAVQENLSFYGRAYGLPGKSLQDRSAYTVRMAGLDGREELRTGALSGGWRQRLALGAAILHDPELVFLVEPTAGVDPVSCRAFWDLLYELVATGTSIFVTMHYYLEEAEHCHRLAFIQRGRLIAEGTGETLLQALDPANPEPVIYLAPGVLEAESVSLASSSGGRVLEELAEEGQAVRPGQVLVRLDTALMEAQRAVLAAQHEGWLARLRMLQNGPRPEDLAVARAAVAQAQAVVESADTGLENARFSNPLRLRDERTDLARAQLTAAEADLDMARSGLEAVKRGTSPEDFEQAKAAVDASAAKLAQMDQQIAAPQQGIVMQWLVEPGELAQPGWPLVSVAGLESLSLVVYLPETELNWVALGEIAWLQLDSQPAALIPGEGVHISDQAQFTPTNVQTSEERVKQVFQVVVQLADSNRRLKPGMPADAGYEQP
jgi:ABC-type multidrug transport system ATPase subunit